jgi:hypothetical protein
MSEVGNQELPFRPSALRWNIPEPTLPPLVPKATASPPHWHGHPAPAGVRLKSPWHTKGLHGSTGGQRPSPFDFNFSRLLSPFTLHPSAFCLMLSALRLQPQLAAYTKPVRSLAKRNPPMAKDAKDARHFFGTPLRPADWKIKSDVLLGHQAAIIFKTTRRAPTRETSRGGYRTSR